MIIWFNTVINNKNLTLDGNLLKAQAIILYLQQDELDTSIYLDYLDKIYGHIEKTRRYNQPRIDTFLIQSQ
jgi:hypothetical protein